MPSFTIREECAAWAEQVHEGQTRRYDGEPYHNHVHRVADITKILGLNDFWQGVAEMHDSVEDHPDRITYEDLNSRFGHHFATAVYYLTKDVQTSKDRRIPKQLASEFMLAKLRGAVEYMPEVLVIKCADRVDNLCSYPEGELPARYISEARTIAGLANLSAVSGRFQPAKDAAILLNDEIRFNEKKVKKE